MSANVTRRALFSGAGQVVTAGALVALPAASVAAHDAIPPAWADYLNVHAAYHTLDDATETILETCAQCPRSAGIKLRRAFIGLVPDAWAERLAMGQETADDLRRLDMSDLYVRMMWSAIVDLELITH